MQNPWRVHFQICYSSKVWAGSRWNCTWGLCHGLICQLLYASVKCHDEFEGDNGVILEGFQVKRMVDLIKQAVPAVDASGGFN